VQFALYQIQDLAGPILYRLAFGDTQDRGVEHLLRNLVWSSIGTRVKWKSEYFQDLVRGSWSV